ncbi:MAG: hypothetical protein OXI71_14025 [Gemmatimonadota bacterium]|nr:hypothetical protein [Gemmatimonadota bacterium]
MTDQPAQSWQTQLNETIDKICPDITKESCLNLRLVAGVAYGMDAQLAQLRASFPAIVRDYRDLVLENHELRSQLCRLREKLDKHEAADDALDSQISGLQAQLEGQGKPSRPSSPDPGT